MATIRRRAWTTGRGEQREAWVVRYADQDGKWRLKTFAGSAMRDWQATTLHEVKQNTHRPDSAAPTVGAAAEAWITRGEADGRERSTLVQRRQHVDLHIVPLLGAGTKLSRIDAGAFRDELLRTRSRALAAKVMTSLRAILKQAKMGHVAVDAEAIRTGGRHKKRLEVGRDIPTPAEVNALLKASSGYMRALLAVAVFCGLRMSEVRALRWQDVSFDERLLHVRQRADKWGKRDRAAQVGDELSLAAHVAVRGQHAEGMAPRPAGRRAGVRERRGERRIAAQHLEQASRPAPGRCGPGRPGRQSQVRGAQLPAFLRELVDRARVSTSSASRCCSATNPPVVTLTVDAHLLPSEDDHAKFAAGEVALVS